MTASRSTTESPQRTLAGEATVRGLGLFTGRAASVTLRPAPADHGVVFRRTDLPDTPLIPANLASIVDRPRRTALRASGPIPGDDAGSHGDSEAPRAVVETVEHLLAALAGLAVDNALVDIDAGELPIGDGSSMLWVEAIDHAGIVALDAPRRPLIITEPITVRSPSGLPDGGEAVIFAAPNESPSLELAYDLDYGLGATLARQFTAFTLRRDDRPAPGPHDAPHGGKNGTAVALAGSALQTEFARRLGPARSYALLAEARAMRERGLFGHVSARDMLVIGDDGPVDNAYRFDDEPARHKTLDLLGDLALIGRPIQGRIYASRSGHALNHRVARALVEQARRSEGGRRRTLDHSGAPGLRPVAMDSREVLRLLPHRYPMALVDRVLEIDGDRRAVGVKNVTINEPFFEGHYPGSPIMPGVLIVEAMSQLAGLMLSQKLERTGKIAVLLSMDRVKLRKPVFPGDQLVMETEAIKASERFGDVQCTARVDGRVVAEARVKFMMVDAEERP